MRRLALGLALLLGCGALRGAEREAHAEPPSQALAKTLDGPMCGVRLPGLDRLAEKLALRKGRGEAPLDLPDLSLAVLEERVPYVWPRAWVAVGPSREALATAYAEHRKGLRATRPICGHAVIDLGAGKVAYAVVELDAKGELVPLKERARVGEFVSVDATLDGDVRDARVMVKGPLGAPRTLPGGFDPASRRVRATFAPDTSGAFTVQIVADTDSGPRPMLETRVFAGIAPSYARERTELVPPSGPPDDALYGLVKQLRSDEGLPPLVRDPKLDEIAKAHVAAMIGRSLLSHDAGDGDPRSRTEDAGVRAKVVAENVATGREVRGLHRALTESPSHHANLRSGALDRVGVAVVADKTGALWGCELFTGGTR